MFNFNEQPKSQNESNISFQDTLSCTTLSDFINKNIHQTEDYLNKLFSKSVNGNLIICSKHKNNGGLIPHVFSIQQINEVPKLVDKLALNNHIYFAIGLQDKPPKRPKRGSQSGVIALPGLSFDLDIHHEDAHKEKKLPQTKEIALKFLDRILPLSPTLIVFSGYGLYVQYLFHKPLSIDDKNRTQIITISKTLHEYIIHEGEKNGFKLDNTGTIDHLYRLPGSYNHKVIESPVLVEEISYNENLRYTIEELSKKFSIKTQKKNSTKSVVPANYSKVIKNIVESSTMEQTQIQPIVASTTKQNDNTIPEGERNTKLTSLAGSMRQNGMDQSTIELAILNDNQKRCNPPLPEEEVRRIVAGIFGYKVNKTFKLTDAGNAERLVDKYHDEIIFCTELGSWFLWNSNSWEQDKNNSMLMKAKETMRAFETQVKQSNPSNANELIKFASRSESLQKLKSMVTLAQADESIILPISKFDRDPLLLSCMNGTIDLNTGLLQPHNSKEYITRVAPVIYDVNSKCPQFITFINQIMNNNQFLVSYIQKIFGYSLTADISEQCLFVLYGGGRNGKSTLLTIIHEVLGEYAKSADYSSFTQINNTLRNDIARLVGSRLVTVTEIPANKFLDEALIKKMTGGDKITARHMHQEHFEFYPTNKLIIAGNHKPKIEGSTYGTWRKIRLIPFNVQISEDQVDKKLLQKLLTELPGILNWAIEGCIRWQQEGLGSPKEVQEATQDYQDDMDKLLDFFSECCVVGDSLEVKRSELYKKYSQWCTQNQEEILKKKDFKSALEERGYICKKRSGAEKFIGVTLKDNLQK